MAGNQISELDRDLMVRTILGEAADQPDAGQAGIAHVVLNRVAKGGYGSSPAAVVLAPSQFEPWQSKPRELMAIDPKSPGYQKTGAIVDGVLSGNVPDPTGGATHFYSPDAQRALGRRPPAWATGQPVVIAGHNFYGGSKQETPDLLGSWTAAPNAVPAAAQPSAPAQPDLLGQWAVPASGPSTQPPAQTTPPATPSGAVIALPAALRESQGYQNQIVNGMPVVGPLMDKAVAATGAVIQPMFGKGAENFGDRYAKNLEELRTDNKLFAAEHPVGSTVANVGGAATALGPLGATSLGARALGMTGPLATRVLSGGLGGAAISGGDAALRGEDVAAGAKVGGFFGMGGAALGPVAGAIGNKLMNVVAPGRVAGNKLLESVGGGEALPAIEARLASNPRLSIMDVDPNAQLLAQGIATQPGRGRAILDEARTGRMDSSGDTIQGAYNSALGPAPDVKALVDGLKHRARMNAAKGFGEALSGAKPVDVSGVLKHIDDVVQPGISGVASTQSGIPLSPPQEALSRIKGMLTDGQSTLTDANRLHSLQQQLRIEAETLGKSSSGQDRLTANALRDVRSKLNDAIDTATGGKFKPAQKQFADDMSVQDAFDKGRTIFNNGKTDLENRPEFWRAAFKDASPSEQNAMKIGARVAVDQEINAARSANGRGTAIPETGFNADKLRVILGDAETNKLMRTLTDERSIAQTNSALFAGSQTQPRAEAAKATAVRDVRPMGAGAMGIPIMAEMIGNSFGHPGVGIPLMAASFARNGLQRIGRGMDNSRNADLAGMLSASGGDRAAMLNRLMELSQGSQDTQARIGRGANLLLQAGGHAYSGR